MTTEMILHYIGYSIPFLLLSFTILKISKRYKTNLDLWSKTILLTVIIAIPMAYFTNPPSRLAQNFLTSQDIKEMNKSFEQLQGNKIDEVTSIEYIQLMQIKKHISYTYRYKVALPVAGWTSETLAELNDSEFVCKGAEETFLKYDNVNSIEISYVYTFTDNKKLSTQIFCPAR